MTDTMKKEEQPAEKLEDQKESPLYKDPAMDASIIIGKIHPISKKTAKEDESSQMTAPQNAFASKIINTEQEPEKQQRIEEMDTGLPPLEQTPQETPEDDMNSDLIKQSFHCPMKKWLSDLNTMPMILRRRFEKLVTFADILTTHPETKILISGYTDSEGYQNL